MTPVTTFPAPTCTATPFAGTCTVFPHAEVNNTSHSASSSGITSTDVIVCLRPSSVIVISSGAAST
ncbi:hypothetical protein D3C78_1792090 [compost metagenome]